VLLQAAGFEGSEGIASPESVQAALEIALARNLTLAGQFESAVQLYGKLEQQGSLGSNPLTSDSYTWVCYGYAAQRLGQAGLCSRVLERAVDEAGSDTSKLHAVMALLQVRDIAHLLQLYTCVYVYVYVVGALLPITHTRWLASVLSCRAAHHMSCMVWHHSCAFRQLRIPPSCPPLSPAPSDKHLPAASSRSFQHVLNPALFMASHPAAPTLPGCP
jgi:hypothetical protein